jgi:REP element-mobilizing transposase RayT
MKPSYGEGASRPQKSHKGWHNRGYLPHYDSAWEIQSISFRLFDAVPNHLLIQWRQEVALNPANKALRIRIESYEDAGYGQCFMNDFRIAELVEGALLYFDKARYRLVAWCVMPNHVHALIEMYSRALLEEVVHSWKSYTSKQANKILQRNGQFWMEDYYDRFIRDENHLNDAIAYIEQNPVKAGLVSNAIDWKYSSAGRRKDRC